MANIIEAVLIKNPFGITDVCSHIITQDRSSLTISDCMPYISTYAYQFWVKSTATHTISFRCDETHKRFDVDEGWQYFSVIFDVKKISNLHLELPQGEYWIYNMKLEIGSYLTDWSPHPEDGIGAYEEKFNNIEQLLALHSSSILNTISLVDKVNQEISNSVSRTTFESEILGVQENISNRFDNIEDGYGKWHISIYDKSDFVDTKPDDNIDDRERYDMGIFTLGNSTINPIDEVLVNDSPVLMRVDARGKVLYYLAFAKFSKDTAMTIPCSHNKATLYLNGLPKFSSGLLGTDNVFMDFTEGWNLIEIVTNEGNFSFNQSISLHQDCVIFNCLMGVPTLRTVRIREQGASLNIYLDRIVSEVFETVTEERQDEHGNTVTVTSLRSRILQNKEMIEFMVLRVETENPDGTVSSSFTIRPEAIEVITSSFIVRGVSGTGSENTTIITGGHIQANTISSDMLATNAIKSLNYKPYDYVEPSEEQEESEESDVPEEFEEQNEIIIKWSKAGTFLDLANGNVYSPSLYIRTPDPTDPNDEGEAWFKGTIYATEGSFEGEITSNSAHLGPWTINEHGIYYGDQNYASMLSGAMYLGEQGISFGNQLVYDSVNNSLRLNVDALSITGKTLYDIVLDNGNRMYYSPTAPTITGYPTTLWADTYLDHIDDMCVDTSTGTIYQFKRSQAQNKYTIIFNSNTYTRPSDYAEIYYQYNHTIHRVLGRVVGNTHDNIVIPTETFYVYWHTSSGTSGVETYWGFSIDSVNVASASATLSPTVSNQNLPNYAVDSSLSAGTYPSTEHPYLNIDFNKIWKCRIVNTETENSYYEWSEVENTVANEANEKATKALSYLHYDITNGLILYDGRTYKNGVLVNEPLPDIITTALLNTLLTLPNVRLTSSGLGIYSGSQLLAEYGPTTSFYKTQNNTTTVAATLGADGFSLLQGSINLGGTIQDPNFSVTTSGDIVAKGTLFIGNSTNYISYDGTNLTLSVLSLSIGGQSVTPGGGGSGEQTDYTPQIQAAARTASNYLYYDSNNGLVIHGENSAFTSATLTDLTSAYVKLLASGLLIWNNKKLLVEYGATTNFYDGVGTSAANIVASYGSSGFAVSKGTIGDINITSNSIYSGSHSAYNSANVGFYLDKNGVFSVGDGTSYLRYFKDTSDNNKWKLDLVVSSLTIGSSPIASLSYADGKASVAQTNALSYADGVAASTLSSAQTYADGKALIAAQTATNYLYYDNTKGLVVTSSVPNNIENITGPNVRINASAPLTGVGIYNGNSLLVNYGTTTNFYDGTGTATSNIIANYGANGFSVSKGAIGGININSTGIYSGTKSSFSSTNNGFFIGSDGSLNIKNTNGNIIKFDSSGLEILTNNLRLNSSIKSLTDDEGINFSLVSDEQIDYTQQSLIDWIKILAARVSLFHIDEYGLHIADRNNIGYYRNLSGESIDGMEEEEFDGIPHPTNLMLSFDPYDTTKQGQGGYISAFEDSYKGGLIFGSRYKSGSDIIDANIFKLTGSVLSGATRVNTQLYFDNTVSFYVNRAHPVSNKQSNFRFLEVNSSSITIGYRYASGSTIQNIFSDIYLQCTNVWKTSSGGNLELSDINKKKEIQEITNAKEFILGIEPRKFKFKDGTSGRFHTGFIAQLVESVMNNTIGDSGVFCNATFGDGEKVSTLRYSEIIAPHVAVTQEHEHRINELESEITELKEQIKTLKNKLGDK